MEPRTRPLSVGVPRSLRLRSVRQLSQKASPDSGKGSDSTSCWDQEGASWGDTGQPALEPTCCFC